MRTLVFAIVLAVSSSPFVSGSPKPTGGTGTIYLGSYARRMVVIDEATEQVTAEIPLTTGIPWSARRSQDATRFYIQNADQEHFEVVDLATRKSIDSFTLSEGNTKVRALAFAVDPQHRIMTLVTRTTTKLADRFEIGAPTFIQYDLRDHKVIHTLPWPTDPEPAYFSLVIRYSPDGKLLYVFSDEVLILDATSLQQLGSWDLSLSNEPALGRFDLGSLDDTNDDPAWFSALFTLKDPVQNRPLLVVGRVNLDQRSLDFFPLGPATEQGQVSFALGSDRHAYALVQGIGHYELWTIDLASKRRQSKVEFKGRPRMAIRTSSNGKIIYLYQAGNTIDLYEADGFKYLRTITLDGDMPYNTFHVVPPRTPR